MDIFNLYGSQFNFPDKILCERPELTFNEICILEMEYTDRHIYLLYAFILCAKCKSWKMVS